MTPFTIERNSYLSQNVQAFHHTDFGGSSLPTNPNYLYKIKNDPHHNWSAYQIQVAGDELSRVLIDELPRVLRYINKTPLTVCVVPRSKAEANYRADQLLFRSIVKKIITQLGSSFIDGTSFIIRHTNTRTTHLRNAMDGFDNDGASPYAGITNDTCDISDEVIGKDILLIDDIYTKTVNIDEDALQSLIDKGANSVSFYAIGNTLHH